MPDTNPAQPQENRKDKPGASGEPAEKRSFDPAEAKGGPQAEAHEELDDPKATATPKPADD